MKAAILQDMLKLGKEGGLKSFEQVGSYNTARDHWPPCNEHYNYMCYLFMCLIRCVIEVCLSLCGCLLQVKDIAIHTEMFSVQNGLLTPTLKSKRTELRNCFREQIDLLYSSNKM